MKMDHRRYLAKQLYGPYQTEIVTPGDKRTDGDAPLNFKRE